MNAPTKADLRVIQWRCFHCGDSFTKEQFAHAREHFGRDEGETPVCLMRVPGESGLIAALRKAQDELANWRAESDPLTRAIECQAADYEQRLIREEEKGYARGLKDYTKVEMERDILRAAMCLVLPIFERGNASYHAMQCTRKDKADCPTLGPLVKLVRDAISPTAKDAP